MSKEQICRPNMVTCVDDLVRMKPGDKLRLHNTLLDFHETVQFESLDLSNHSDRYWFPKFNITKPNGKKDSRNLTDYGVLPARDGRYNECNWIEQIVEPQKYSLKEVLELRDEGVYSIHYDGFDRYYLAVYHNVVDLSKMQAVIVSPSGYLLDPIEDWYKRGKIFVRTDKLVTITDRI